MNPTGPADYSAAQSIDFFKKTTKNGKFSKERKENCPLELRTAPQVGPGTYNSSKPFFMAEKCPDSRFPSIPSHTIGKKLSNLGTLFTPGPGTYMSPSDFGIYVSSHVKTGLERSLNHRQTAQRKVAY